MVNRSLPGALPGARVLYRMQASWEQMGVVRLAFKEQLIRRTYPGRARTSSARANSVSRDAPGASGSRRPARLAFALSLVRSSQPARRLPSQFSLFSSPFSVLPSQFSLLKFSLLSSPFAYWWFGIAASMSVTRCEPGSHLIFNEFRERCAVLKSYAVWKGYELCRVLQNKLDYCSGLRPRIGYISPAASRLRRSSQR